MEQANLYTLLKTTGLEVAYHHFEEDTNGPSSKPPPKPPYIIYIFNDSDNFGADNKVFAKVDNYQVELYTKIKDTAKEKLIEDLFDNNEIFYDKSETYIDSEKLYQVLYEIGI